MLNGVVKASFKP